MNASEQNRLRSRLRAAAALALVIAVPAHAQIYTCTGEDGTRIFSDERCGPDAKIVPNISTQKSPAKKSTTPRSKIEPKPAAELDELLKKCNDGDMPSCTTWTRAGGPNNLRDKERKAEEACQAGSLADCEYRYCNGAVSDDCRANVLQAAKVAGENWYLRTTGSPQPDGSTVYDVRCIPPGARAMRDVVVSCAAKAGPTRCGTKGGQGSYARLDLAAAQVCAAN